MKDWVNRSLSRIFRRASQRDRMLADLYVVLRMEKYSDLVLQRALAVSHKFHDSFEVADCIGVAIDYVADAEMPRRGIELSNYILRSVREGPVFDVIVGRMVKLHHHESMEIKIKRDTSALLNRLRIRALHPDTEIINTYFCFRDSPKRYPVIYPRPEKISPEEFKQQLRI